MFKKFLINNFLTNPILFVIILLLSLIFRITNLDLIEFKTDEAINILLASRPIFGHLFVPGGTVSSIGVLNPPLFNYLLFPLTVVSLDPRWISFVIGLVNSLAIAFLFLIIKKYYNQTIAIVSTLLMALSPWAIIYSRKIWTQDLLIPFFVPFFWSYNKLLAEKKQIFWIPYWAFSLMLIQLHQIVIIFIGILTIFLLQKVRINFRYLIIGIIIGTIPLIPYVNFEIKNGCPDCKAFILARNKLSFERSPELFMKPLQIASQGDFRFILGNDTLAFSQKFPLADSLRKIFYLEYLLIPLGAAIFIKKFKKTRSVAYSVFLLPIVYFLLKIEPFMHYYIIIMPLIFIFLAVSFEYFLSNKNLLLKFIGFGLLSLITIESIAFNFSFFELIKNQGSLKGDYGSTYKNSNKKIEDNLAIFKNRPDYQEIKLSNYIPYSQLFGYMPLPKMLFSYNNTDKRISYLENLWKKNDNDPRIGEELLALNTIDPLTKNKIDYLWLKQQNITQYKKIYDEAKSTYLYQSYKLNHYSNQFHFSFDYPSYWKIKESQNKIEIYVDKYILFLEPLTEVLKKDEKFITSKIKILSQEINKDKCTLNYNWCGTKYYPIAISGNIYILKLIGVEVKYNSIKDIEKNLEELINSIREY